MNIKTLGSLNQQRPPKEDKKPPPPAKHKVMGEIKAVKKESTSPYFTYNGNQLVEVDDDSLYGDLNRLFRKLRINKTVGNITLKEPDKR
ncbi:hypothetical protein ACTL6P_23985 [Endozoicomonas acroporae]|uniref:hypothetical protein n=1 Tax=Endozoicomonas acroporae TaxID=1701104 RepID=UPI000C77591B|nr:hypothetical protein [Endozoicomonas acroporae]